jgi:hypothetical protein
MQDFSVCSNPADFAIDGGLLAALIPAAAPANSAAAQAIAAGLNATLAARGESVVVAFASGGSAGILAARGASTFEAIDSAGMTTNVDSVDWLCRAGDYVKSGAVVLPRGGDTITDGAGAVYEVLRIAGQKPYRLDPFAIQLRIHTKKVGSSG